MAVSDNVKVRTLFNVEVVKFVALVVPSWLKMAVPIVFDVKSYGASFSVTVTATMRSEPTVAARSRPAGILASVVTTPPLGSVANGPAATDGDGQQQDGGDRLSTRQRPL